MKLKVGGVPEHFNLPWKLAIEDGELSEAGIKLHWTDMPGGTGQMVRGLENKTLDVGILLTEGITKAILQGLKVKILQIYVITPLHWGVHVPYNSSFQSMDDLENQTFAISRFGSGSHLMAYVMADRQGWKTDDLKFNVIGDVYGGIWSLETNEAQIFLWDKYMTHPFTVQKKCRFVDEVITPWPCFAIAVREEVYELYKKELEQMCLIVNAKALELKKDPDAVEIISWRYNLKTNQIQNWLNETDWNYNGEPFHEEFGETVDYLLKLNLITAEEAENWNEKLF